MEPKVSPQYIYESLKTMITALQIIPGSRITETQLADYFHVSRTPIRAALQRLESEGLISIRPKQGCFVRNIDMLQISQYYDARIALESIVVEEIANLKDHSELKELSDRWNPQNATYGAEISDEIKYQDENFHLELARIAKNTVLENYLVDINNHIRAVRRLGWPDVRSVKDTYEEHYQICRLLLNNNLRSAKKALEAHIRKSQELANRVTLQQLYNRENLVKFD